MSDRPSESADSQEPSQISDGDGAGEGERARDPEAQGKNRAEERHARRRRQKQVALPSVPEPRSIRRRIGNVFRVAEERAEHPHERDRGSGIVVLQVVVQVFRQWARDRCFEKAASLAFQTVLSVVPLLALALLVLRWSGSIDAESTFVDFVSRELIPVSREVIAEKLSAWSGNISIQSLGIVGLVVTILFSFMIVLSMEGTVNSIWRAERKRSLAQKFVVFYATITIGPFLVGTSLYQAAKFGLTEGYSGLVFSLLTSYGGLFLANYFLPATAVRLIPAALGALVSAILFEIARYAFQGYVTHFAFASYSGIYGALGLVPLWLLWVYYSWLMFLLGIEVAHASQNFQILQRRDRRKPMSLENELIQRVNGVMAARIMLAISAAYMRGDKVTPRQDIEELFDLSGEALRRIIHRLKKNELIIEVQGELSGYVPARPPSEISLAEVLAAFRSDDIVYVSEHPKSQLDRILADLDKHSRTRTQDIYFDQLV